MAVWDSHLPVLAPPMALRKGAGGGLGLKWGTLRRCVWFLWCRRRRAVSLSKVLCPTSKSLLLPCARCSSALGSAQHLPPSAVVGARSRTYWCQPSCLGLSVRVVWPGHLAEVPTGTSVTGEDFSVVAFSPPWRCSSPFAEPRLGSCSGRQGDVVPMTQTKMKA